MRTKAWTAVVAILTCMATGLGCVTTVSPRVDRVDRHPVPVAPWGPEDEPFYYDLAPHGEWVHVSGPGWVWSPYRMPAGWQPYRAGHWVLTDYGWTWASDEPFGWVVYHYGRWHTDARYGWVWVPGTDWGPAWVAWHEGGDWVGWAPLPWQVRWRAGVGLDWGGLDIRVALAPASWCFVPARHVVDPRLSTYIAPAARNGTLIRNTIHVTNYTYIDNRVVNQSLKPEKIGRAVGHTVRRYPLAPASSSDAPRGGKVQDGKFVVYRPEAEVGAASSTPRPGMMGKPVPQGPQGHPRRTGKPARAGAHPQPAAARPEPAPGTNPPATSPPVPEPSGPRRPGKSDQPAPPPADSPYAPPTGPPSRAEGPGAAKKPAPEKARGRKAADPASKSGKSKAGKPDAGAENCDKEKDKDCPDPGNR